MKRIFAVLLLTVFILSGCSAQKHNSEKATAQNITSSENASTEKSTKVASTEKSSSSEKSVDDNLKKLEPIKKGTVNNNNYINESLGFKIILPDKWEYSSQEELNAETPELEKYGDKNEEYFIAKITDIGSGYDIEDVSVSVNLKSGYKSLDDYKKYVNEHFNDDPDYMYTKDMGYRKIGNRNYWHVKYVYPTANDVYYDLFACYENGAFVCITFQQLDDNELESFIKNNIVNI